MIPSLLCELTVYYTLLATIIIDSDVAPFHLYLSCLSIAHNVLATRPRGTKCSLCSIMSIVFNERLTGGGIKRRFALVVVVVED